MHARTGLLVAALFGLVVFAGGCGDEETSTTSSSATSSTSLVQQTTTTIVSAPLVFTAELNGANAVPPVTTNAKGTLTLTVQPDGTVDYVVTIKKLTNITVARLRGGVGSPGRGWACGEWGSAGRWGSEGVDARAGVWGGLQGSGAAVREPKRVSRQPLTGGEGSL